MAGVTSKQDIVTQKRSAPSSGAVYGGQARIAAAGAAGKAAAAYGQLLNGIGVYEQKALTAIEVQEKLTKGQNELTEMMARNRAIEDPIEYAKTSNADMKEILSSMRKGGHRVSAQLTTLALQLEGRYVSRIKGEELRKIHDKALVTIAEAGETQTNAALEAGGSEDVGIAIDIFNATTEEFASTGAITSREAFLMSSKYAEDIRELGFTKMLQEDPGTVMADPEKWMGETEYNLNEPQKMKMLDKIRQMQVTAIKNIRKDPLAHAQNQMGEHDLSDENAMLKAQEIQDGLIADGTIYERRYTTNEEVERITVAVKNGSADEILEYLDVLDNSLKPELSEKKKFELYEKGAFSFEGLLIDDLLLDVTTKAELAEMLKHKQIDYEEEARNRDPDSVKTMEEAITEDPNMIEFKSSLDEFMPSKYKNEFTNAVEKLTLFRYNKKGGDIKTIAKGAVADLYHNNFYFTANPDGSSLAVPKGEPNAATVPDYLAEFGLEILSRDDLHHISGGEFEPLPRLLQKPELKENLGWHRNRSNDGVVMTYSGLAVMDADRNEIEILFKDMETHQEYNNILDTYETKQGPLPENYISPLEKEDPLVNEEWDVEMSANFGPSANVDPYIQEVYGGNK